MFATIAGDRETTKRTLSPDDIRAVCAIYPGEQDPHACALDMPDDGCGCSGPAGRGAGAVERALALLAARLAPPSSARAVELDAQVADRRLAQVRAGRDLQLLLGVAEAGRDDGQPPVAGDEPQQPKRAVPPDVGARLRAARARPPRGGRARPRRR